jgi:arabinose-5-phosphate isomerase
MNICEIAKDVLKIEAEAIKSLISKIDQRFEEAVRLILECKGRVVLTGVGKSGIIAEKIASTLASTGTPSFFLHPADSAHGDIGMVTKDDLLIVVSKSGRTEEIERLLPSIKWLGIKVIAICGDIDSFLAKNADLVLDVSIEREACSLGIVPTASTTTSLAMGDALAVALLRERRLTKEEFALLHPGGALGRELLLKVCDLMHKGNEIPIVYKETSMKDAIFEMSRKRLGITTVVDREGRLCGIITDGDLRRLLEREPSPLSVKAESAMTENPKRIEKDALAVKALRVMEDFSITSLIIVDKESRPEGVIHMHDILKAGLKNTR